MNKSADKHATEPPAEWKIKERDERKWMQPIMFPFYNTCRSRGT
jgi:hypothetical protein